MYYQGIQSLKAKSIVVYVNKDIFGPLFYELKETSTISRLFAQAVRGLRITRKTNTAIAQKLKTLSKKKDFDVIVGLFETLSILSASDDLSFINNEAYTPVEDSAKTDRLSVVYKYVVYKYVKEHYAKDITLASISQLAHLTPPSFCRLFKARTKKHFVEYLSEVRIANACKFLMETDMSISEIAYACGYKTVSNFNKLLKKITRLTPQAYKKNTSSTL